MTGAVSTTYILSFVAEDDEIEIEDYDHDTDVYTITTQDIVYVAC